MGPNEDLNSILQELAKRRAAKKQQMQGADPKYAEKFAKHSTKGAMLRKLKKNQTGIGGF